MFPSDYPSGIQYSESTVFLVTGATGAIGKAIARQLAAKPNAEVVLVCRNPTKGEQAQSASVGFRRERLLAIPG